MAMNDLENRVLDAIATVALHVLALPFIAVKALGNLRKLARTTARLRAGEVTCPYCATVNTLNMMTRCACGAVEPGSRLRCSFCGAIYNAIPCAGCSATLRIL
jgi:hypothetical protein